MAKGTEDLQMLRLIRAFQKLIEPDRRRMVLLYVEEQVHKQQAGAVGKSPPGVGGGTNLSMLTPHSQPSREGRFPSALARI
jgi:hypothetical protein